MKDSLECPVDFMPINENKARLTAFFVFVLSIWYLFTQTWIIPAFLVIDFFVRVNNWGKYSLLGVLSDAVIKQVKIPNKSVDRAPKRFAAGVGLIFSLAILLSSLLHWTLMAIILTAIIVLFAFLESFVGFCAGCYVYSVIKKVSNSFKNRQLNTK